MKRTIILSVIVLAISSLAFAAQGPVLSDLKVNRLGNAAGIDPDTPVSLGWIISSDKNNTVQSAYEIIVTKDGAPVWKSGKVESDNSIGVPCDVRMDANSMYKWRVRIWDNYGRVSGFASSSWTTGLRADDWTARWLCADSYQRPVYLKRGHNINKKVKKAVAFISAKGLYEVTINGRGITEDVLTPGWTEYGTRIQYQAYDVTHLLNKGGNEIIALLAPGWYSSGLSWGKPSNRFRYGQGMAFTMQVNITYSDGSAEVINTDKDWKMSYGPVTEATIYDGQSIDANIPFNWNMSPTVEPLDANHLVASASEGVRRHSVLRPVAVITTPEGDTVIDFGQNIVGWEKVSMTGQKGDTVVIRHAEVLDKEGNFYTKNLRSAKATSTYVLSGGRDEFEPTMTFYGFRYISVKGLRGAINPDDFSAVAISSSFDNVGAFNTSDPIINQLQSNIVWGFHDNFVDVPTDCPQRDERLGWTGDAQVFFRTATFNGRVENFFRKWLADLSIAQREDGSVPRVVPDIFASTKSKCGATGWADCATIIPWNHYMAYGDKSVLEAQMPSMMAWVDWCVAQSKDNGWLLNQNLDRHYGDWLFYHKFSDNDGKSAVTSKAMIAQAFFAHSASIVARSAEVLGRKAEAARYREIFENVKKAFNDEYVTPNGLICSDTQTAYVLALHFDLLPEDLRSKAADRLVENIHRYNDHITTGFLGTPYICDVLTRTGHSDVAYTLLLQKTCPSWIYQVTKGATTIWERWDSIQPDGSILVGMNSFNHYSFGAIGDWLYRDALGIRESSPGYKTIVIDPHAGADFSFMEGSTITPYGRVAAKWTADKGTITSLEVEIPVNTTAEIHFGGECHKVGSGKYKYSK